ncbi:Lon protease-like protein, mitochondrial [Frankliniella fusca]|uniref:Lon protease-like protein, mitochondrial n=1 Tax=Frankliniella fusca TaxID=407009 RepID=A0AAE1LKU8_9NEOP|nr:Lon protease-like protein, mitochondrial [Frankliniella fusca]
MDWLRVGNRPAIPAVPRAGGPPPTGRSCLPAPALPLPCSTTGSASTGPGPPSPSRGPITQPDARPPRALLWTRRRPPRLRVATPRTRREPRALRRSVQLGSACSCSARERERERGVPLPHRRRAEVM